MAGNGPRRRQRRQLIDAKPARILDLVFLHDDFATGIFGVEAEHQRMRERPALAADVVQVLHLDADFLAHLARHAMLHRFARLDEAGQGAVDARDEARRTGQQDLVPTRDQHDHARRDARIVLRLAAVATHRSLSRQLARRRTAAATEAMLGVPGADLRGVRQHAESLRLALQHELT